jgi:hypothetical protein
VNGVYLRGDVRDVCVDGGEPSVDRLFEIV